LGGGVHWAARASDGAAVPGRGIPRKILRSCWAGEGLSRRPGCQEGQMGRKLVRFGSLRPMRSRQDAPKEVHAAGWSRPSSGGNGGHVVCWGGLISWLLGSKPVSGGPRAAKSSLRCPTGPPTPTHPPSNTGDPHVSCISARPLALQLGQKPLPVRGASEVAFSPSSCRKRACIHNCTSSKGASICCREKGMR
jgi:hypothetical protein